MGLRNMIYLLISLALSGCMTMSGPAMETPAPVPTQYMPEPAILIYSDTGGWRHEEGIAGGSLALIEIARNKGLGYFTTQHSEIFNAASLTRFDLVVFNNATGDTLTEPQKAAFRQWLKNNGSAILIHGSLDASQAAWQWYQHDLVGTRFISHPMAPQIQTADLVTLAPDHPVMNGMPGRFEASDEWYSFDAVPDERFTILMGLDETTYSPRNTVYGPEDLRMGDRPGDHPVAWARCLQPDRADGGGRIVASALGHTVESFEAAEHRQFLSNAIDWTRQAGNDRHGC